MGLNIFLGHDLARRMRLRLVGGSVVDSKTGSSGTVSCINGLLVQNVSCLANLRLGVYSRLSHEGGKNKSHGCESSRYEGDAGWHSVKRNSSHLGETGVCVGQLISNFGSKSFKSHNKRSRSNLRRLIGEHMLGDLTLGIR